MTQNLRRMTALLLMFIVGVVINGCSSTGEKGDPGDKGDKGDPGDKGDKGDKGDSGDATFESRVQALENAAYCPRLVDGDGHLKAYKPDLKSPGIVRCTFGADEMVKVGAFWIDRYEAALVPDTFYTNSKASPASYGTCDGSGSSYGTSGGAKPDDDYPLGFPDNGNWSVKVYTCSVTGQLPSQMMTWFQAQQACVLAGKRLCRNDEWQAAVAGTVDPGTSDGTAGSCVTAASNVRASGGGTACRSAYGAEDMIGNVQEWVADWFASPWSDQANVGNLETWGSDYGDDMILNVSGTANDPSAGGLGQRRPAAGLRGGTRENLPGAGEAAGAFFFNLYSAPSFSLYETGARCCAGGT